MKNMSSIACAVCLLSVPAAAQHSDTQISETTSISVVSPSSTLLIAQFGAPNAADDTPSVHSENPDVKRVTDTVRADAVNVIYTLGETVSEVEISLVEVLALGPHVSHFYYMTDDTALVGGQEESLRMLLSAASRLDSVDVVITGRADPRGDSEYNKRLSERRAQVVAEIAIEEGVSESSLQVHALGEVGDEHELREKMFFQRHTTVELVPRELI